MRPSSLIWLLKVIPVCPGASDSNLIEAVVSDEVADELVVSTSAFLQAENAKNENDYERKEEAGEFIFSIHEN